uniref:Odorant receptor n=1 Tax=Trichogramma kaykai TaxID=54128 RepID=A0ABD2X7N6_9HYME
MVIIPGAIVYPVVVPCLLNYLVPGNASFEPIVITQAYGGFENEDHLLVLIFILLNYAVAMTLCINACTGAFIFMIIFIVGKFKVLGWRLDKLHARLDDDRVVYSSVKRNEDLFYRHVAELIKDHASCYYFLDQIAALSSTLLFIALGLAVFGLTVSDHHSVRQESRALPENGRVGLQRPANGIRLVLRRPSGDRLERRDFRQSVPNSPFLLSINSAISLASIILRLTFCFFFFFLFSRYATGWYKLPKRSRKLIFFMLMRSTKSSGIMGGFVKLNYETYNWAQQVHVRPRHVGGFAQDEA